MSARLLLCTDMDRTVIPNGMQAEHPNARRRFRKFCQLENVCLVYVTGRHRQLVEKAIRTYSLPQPDYIISDVGTKIFQYKDKRWQEVQSWCDEIAKDWNGQSHSDLKALLSDIKDLQLQEFSKQNTHKLSFYLPLYLNKDEVIAQVHKHLQKNGINASVMWSIDELTKFNGLGIDAYSGATPLDAMKTQIVLDRHPEFISSQELFGMAGGLGWEWINIWFALGGIWLIYRKVISWHVPVAMILALLIISSITTLIAVSYTHLTLPTNREV